MPWLKSHSELRNHPKTAKAARQLGVGIPQLIGHLHMLWWWVVDYAPGGDLSDFSAEDVALAAGWEGDPEAFVEALVSSGMGSKSGFLERREDGGLLVHDWDQHGGRDIEVRKASAERKRRWREERTEQDDSGQDDSGQEEGRTVVLRMPRAADGDAARGPQVRGERGERREKKHPPYTPPSGGECLGLFPEDSPEVPAKPRRKGGDRSPSPEFERFWASYPRKVAKDAAWQVWCRLFRGSYGVPPRGPEELVAAAARYGDECRADCREQDRILHARTFLGPQRRWTDYVREGPSPPGVPAPGREGEPSGSGDPARDLKARMRARQEAERGLQHCRDHRADEGGGQGVPGTIPGLSRSL